MNIHQAQEFVEESEQFKAFKKDNPDSYLVHGFCTKDKEQSPWQIGYYSKTTKKITSFLADETVTTLPEDEAFRKEGHVPAINSSTCTTSLDDALSIAEKIKEEEHRAEDITKRIIILQQLDDVLTWNITLITNVFTMLNVRVNAVTGEQISVTKDSILNLGKRT